MLQRIVFLLQQRKSGLSFISLCRALEIPPGRKSELEAALRELVEQGLLLKLGKRYFLRPQTKILRGRMVSVHRGFGFVRPEENAFDDVFIPSRHSGGALRGDLVEIVSELSGPHGKREGRVLRILDKPNPDLLGVYLERGGRSYVFPFDSPSRDEIAVDRGSLTVRPGMIVRVGRESGRIETVLGFPDEPGVDTDVVIQRFDLIPMFSDTALTEAARIPGTPGRKDIEGRSDFREWTTVTIDGPDARDFDDAVSIERRPDGTFLIGVHIADVSHYVKPGRALDIEARRRGTSVYFPDRTLPMLPERLSNQICSLRPREDKLTLSVLLTLNSKGEILDRAFHRSVIRTKERLIYDSVFRIFQGDEHERAAAAPLVEPLLQMREAARRLRRRRVSAGGLDFDLVEPSLIYNQGRLERIEVFERNEAHQVIEEFMVAANEAVASVLVEKGEPLLFRAHPPPSLQALEKLRDLIKPFGLDLPVPEKITSRDLQALLKKAEGQPEGKFITIRVLRSLRLAVYSENNPGHYGLAKKNYTHFTSPIRRYPDLLIHRLLKKALFGDEGVEADLSAEAEHGTACERLADNAERELLEWRIFRFLKTKLGEEFDGIVTDVGRAGLIVELDDYFVSGLIFLEDLPGEAVFKRGETALLGRRSGQVFDIGQRVRVLLAAVDPLRREMTLVPVKWNQQ